MGGPPQRSLEDFAEREGLTASRRRIGRTRRRFGSFWHREDLIERIAIENEPRSQQEGPGSGRVVLVEFEDLCEGGIGVEAESPGVAHRHQEKVKQDGLTGQPIDEPLPNKPSVNPAETSPGNNPEARGIDGLFLHLHASSLHDSKGPDRARTILRQRPAFHPVKTLTNRRDDPKG